MLKEIDKVENRFANDLYRPQYHFMPPANWMNDPNGAIFWKGEHHLFYQYNPNGAFHGTICWGHAVSADLVHWRHLPIAMAPSPDGPDAKGLFSGGPGVVHNGLPMLVYYGVDGGMCLASSRDDLVRWEKWPTNPVIAPASDDVPWRLHDPCMWKEQDPNRGDRWYMISGAHVGSPRAIGTSRDAAFMFRSKDLLHWEYLHPLYEPGEESDCAVPSFFPLGDKHVLLFASHTRGAQYYVGEFKGEKFVIQQHGRMNFTRFDRKTGNMMISGDLISPIAWRDDRGRCIMLAWIAEGRDLECQKASGWSGIMALPRILDLGGDGRLTMRPAPELEVLRQEHRSHNDLKLEPGEARTLEDPGGESLELAAMFEPGDAGVVGVKFRCSPDGAEETRVVYDSANRTLSLDVSDSTVNQDVTAAGLVAQSGPLELRQHEALNLRIYIDRSVVEVFNNGTQSLTKRIYPSRPDSLRLAVFAERASARLQRMDVWEMRAAEFGSSGLME